MPAAKVIIAVPNPGGTIPTAAPASPLGHMSGTFQEDNAPVNKIVCRIIYPAATGLLATQLVIERDAEIIMAGGVPDGRWRVDFGALQPGLDTCLQAELFVDNPARRVDTATLEDVDVLNAPLGTLNPPVPIVLPVPTIP